MKRVNVPGAGPPAVSGKILRATREERRVVGERLATKR